MATEYEVKKFMKQSLVDARNAINSALYVSSNSELKTTLAQDKKIKKYEAQLKAIRDRIVRLTNRIK